MPECDRIEDIPVNLPALYHRPIPLSAARHAGHRVDTRVGHGFAADVSSVPLNAVEFVTAARTYPIVFTAGEAPVPVATINPEDEWRSSRPPWVIWYRAD